MRVRSRRLQTAGYRSRSSLLCGTVRPFDVSSSVFETRSEKAAERERMAGDAEGENLKGLAKHFNSITDRGRANVAKATYAAMALIGLYYYLKPKKAKAAPTAT